LAREVVQKNQGGKERGWGHKKAGKTPRMKKKKRNIEARSEGSETNRQTGHATAKKKPHQLTKREGPKKVSVHKKIVQATTENQLKTLGPHSQKKRGRKKSR